MLDKSSNVCGSYVSIVFSTCSTVFSQCYTPYQYAPFQFASGRKVKLNPFLFDRDNLLNSHVVPTLD